MKGKEILKTLEKYCAVDIGLRFIIIGFKTVKDNFPVTYRKGIKQLMHWIFLTIASCKI